MNTLAGSILRTLKSKPGVSVVARLTAERDALRVALRHIDTEYQLADSEGNMDPYSCATRMHRIAREALVRYFD